MKKVFALLLTVMMLAGISCAWAEGTTEEAVEITFQGITWGSSVEAVAEWVVQREEFTRACWQAGVFLISCFRDMQSPDTV